MRLILAYNTSFSYWGSSKFGSRKISKFRIALPIEHPFYNRYPIHMFLFNTCQKPDCQLYAAHGEDYCLHHVDNPEACNTRLVEIIHDTKVLKDLNSSCINVEDSDFSDHTFMVCNFSESSFKNIDFSHSSFDLCFLQYYDLKTVGLLKQILSTPFSPEVLLLTVILRIPILCILIF